MRGQILDDIVSGAVAANPALLARFLLLVFADLKAQKFVHWFAYPTLAPAVPFQFTAPPRRLEHLLSADERRRLREGIHSLSTATGRLQPYFIVHYAPASGAGGSSVAVHALSVAPEPVVPCERWFGVIDSCQLDAHPGWLTRYVMAGRR